MITVSDATVKTVSVDVKVVRIDKKAMTLSVFRQLPEYPCFAFCDFEGLSLIGNIWGYVNYCQKECLKNKKHIHVIHQVENILYQDTVYLCDLVEDNSTIEKHKVAEKLVIYA